MIRPTIGYFLKFSFPILAGVGILGWLFVSRLKEVDSLARLEKSMGLYQLWQERISDLERRHPFTDDCRANWGVQQLEDYLAVKEEVAAAAADLRKHHPSLAGGHLQESPEQPEGLLEGLMTLRSRFLSLLERRGTSFFQYVYFDGLTDLQRSQYAGEPSPAALSAEQRALLQRFRERIVAADTRGLELFGLPSH